MKYSALIGNPTGHSVSHIMYGELAKAAGIPDFYQHIRLDIEHENLGKALKALDTLGFIGLNVTLPYKLDVMQYLDAFDPVISELGAVNTIKLGETKTGHNTDWTGIVESVKRFGGLDYYETATVFGTGGAARAAIYACKQLGVQHINVLYRMETSPGTRKLQEQSASMGITLSEYSHIADRATDSQLIINATSAGMVDKEPWPFEARLLETVNLEGKVFLDAVFNPLETPLLTYFKEKSATSIDGLWMMIYQGIRSLSIWTDHQIVIAQDDLTEIHNLLEKELNKNV
ncbi:MAG: shikimate dehydrogenase family protein [Candidatus Saccharimonadales bacterium]